MTPIQQTYALTAKTIIKNLQKRNMEGYYTASCADAVALVASLLPQNATVTNGGSETLKESGLLDLLHSGSYRYIDRALAKSDAEQRQLKADTICADAFFMSSNAITLDGELINIDGTGNRVSYLIYGPEYVYVIVGMNKVVTSVEEGISRARNIAAPPNAVRLNRDTPCSMVGYCRDCQTDGCICCQTVITRRSIRPDRIKVILIGEALGF